MAEPGKKKLVLILSGVIGAATLGAMAWASGSEKPEKAPADRGVEVIEVTPMVPRARIADASWRTGEPDETDEAEDAVEEQPSLIGSAEWENLGTDQEARKRKEESLRKALEKVQGLGVVVHEKDDPDEPAEAPRKRK